MEGSVYKLRIATQMIQRFQIFFRRIDLSHDVLPCSWTPRYWHALFKADSRGYYVCVKMGQSALLILHFTIRTISAKQRIHTGLNCPNASAH
jgi:hypothetical protein